MIRFSLILVVVGAIAVPSRTIRRQAAVPLEIADGGYLFVRARLAGAIDARLMVDTGAGISTVSTSILRALGPNARPAGRHSGTRHNGETVSGPIWSIPSLTLGPQTRTETVVGEFAPSGADGLLSMDFFRDQPFTLDLASGRLLFESAESLRDVASSPAAAMIPLRLKTNGPNELDLFVRICIADAVEAESEFDTGAGFNMLMLQPAYMAKLQITPPVGPRGAMEYYVHSTTVPEMHYCAAPAVQTTSQFVGFKAGLIYEGLVGHGAFRGRHLTIDIPGQRMLAW